MVSMILKGIFLGQELSQDKKKRKLHLLQGFESVSITTNDFQTDYEKGEEVEIPVVPNVFNGRLYFSTPSR